MDATRDTYIHIDATNTFSGRADDLKRDCAKYIVYIYIYILMKAGYRIMIQRTAGRESNWYYIINCQPVLPCSARLIV